MIANRPKNGTDIGLFRTYALTPAAMPQAQSYASVFWKKLAALELKCLNLPADQRHNCTVMLMLRQHEYSLLRQYKREKPD